MKIPSIFGFVVFAMLGGCSQPTSPAPGAPSPSLRATSDVPSPASSPKANGVVDLETPSGIPSPNATPTETPKTSTDIPVELKHAAYRYYGLSFDQPMNMEVVTTGNSGNRTGSQTTTLKKYKNGVAIYSVQRTGGLADLGSMEVRLEKSGIFVQSSPLAKIGPHDIEMPASLEPGTKWQSNSEIDNPGQKIKIDSTFRVVRFEKVTTKKGSYDALLISSTGSGMMNGDKIVMETRSWYVKDRGNVKAVITTKSAKGKVNTVTLQETP